MLKCLVVWIWRRVSQLDKLTMTMMPRQVLSLLAVFAFTSALSLSGQSAVGRQAFVAAVGAAKFNLNPDTSVHELMIPCWILLSNSGRTRYETFLSNTLQTILVKTIHRSG